MAEGDEELDKSETATPFKLDRARRKGMVARGSDLGYLSALLGLAIVVQLFGAQLLMTIQLLLWRSFTAVPMAQDSRWVVQLFGQEANSLVSMLILPIGVVVSIAIVVEIIQIRGVVFSAAPLKPDFTRLSPAKGLKRLFSLRMLKELAKNLVKFVLYAGGAFLLLRHAMTASAMNASDGRRLGGEIVSVAGQLLLMFIVIAAAMAVLDQILARREFGKQMRMSKREVTREVREREGEPRQKRQRKQILTDILKQAAAATNVKGADVLIVNPTHYAVALRYRAEEGDAPVVQARGRNIYAQRMRRAAERECIVIVRNPRLARALFHEGQVGRQIGAAHFVAVADIYIMLRRATANGQKAESPQ
jgi:flagellar biosynthesis protein FlhB